MSWKISAYQILAKIQYRTSLKISIAFEFFIYFCAVSDTSVVEGESQIQMGRFISFLQVWYNDLFELLLIIYIYIYFWTLFYLVVCYRSCLALCRAAWKWWSTWFTSWLLCTTAASEKCKTFSYYVDGYVTAVLLIFYFFCMSQECNKNHWVHRCTLSGNSCPLHMVLHCNLTSCIDGSLCLQSDSVRASGRTSGGPHHPGWDHGEPRHTERSLEDVQKVKWDLLDVELLCKFYVGNWRQNEGLYSMIVLNCGS